MTGETKIGLGYDAHRLVADRPLVLGGIKVPTLILTHRSDKCAVTPPKGAHGLKKRLTGNKQVAIKQMKGGSLRISGACKALGPHGFFGIEQKTIRAIGEFITRF